MINPPDLAQMLAKQHGTQTVEPVTPDDWASQTPPGFDAAAPFDKAVKHRRFEWSDIILAAGATACIKYDLPPDKVFILTDDTAAARIRVYLGALAGGPFLLLGRAGHVKMPGCDQTAFTFVNSGANSTNIVVIAMSNDVDLDYSFGSFA